MSATGSSKQQATASNRPTYVDKMIEVFGGPSSAAFGSAVFYENLPADEKLEDAALRSYRTFVGEQWQARGEKTWMGHWAHVYTRPARMEGNVTSELASITDREAASSLEMLINGHDDPAAANAALTAAADDPAVSELAVWRIGDGEAMSGVVIAIRRNSEAEATCLVFLMD